MTRLAFTGLALALVVLPAMADAGSRHHWDSSCCCGSASAMATAPAHTATAATPATPPAMASNNQYQSFSYEPGATPPAPAMTSAPVYRVQSTSSPRYVPTYLRPAYKAHGRYEP